MTLKIQSLESHACISAQTMNELPALQSFVPTLTYFFENVGGSLSLVNVIGGCQSGHFIGLHLFLQPDPTGSPDQLYPRYLPHTHTFFPCRQSSSPYGFSLFRGCHSESPFSILTYSLYLLVLQTMKMVIFIVM